MKDFDKLFDDLFSEDFAEIEAELDALDSEDPGEHSSVAQEKGAAEAETPEGELQATTESEFEGSVGTELPTTLSFYDDEEEEDAVDDEFIEDTEVGGTFESSCPYCGEAVSIFLDPAGGSVQDYVEDCSVCCQPMTVRVRFAGEGQADVMIGTTG
jgi:Cysteine-rich CPXCG